LNVIVGWFNEKRGMAYGILSTGSSIGGVIFPIMINRLIPKVGFGWAMRIAAFLILFLLILAILTVKSRFPSNKQHLSRKQIMAPLSEPVFIALNAGLCLFTFGMFVPINYLVIEATSHGMSPDLAQYLVAMFNAARFVHPSSHPITCKHLTNSGFGQTVSSVVSLPDSSPTK